MFVFLTKPGSLSLMIVGAGRRGRSRNRLYESSVSNHLSFYWINFNSTLTLGFDNKERRWLWSTSARRGTGTKDSCPWSSVPAPTALSPRDLGTRGCTGCIWRSFNQRYKDQLRCFYGWLLGQERNDLGAIRKKDPWSKVQLPSTCSPLKCWDGVTVFHYLKTT